MEHMQVRPDIDYDDTLTIPRAVRFPVEMIPPIGFDPARLETWPIVAGRLEYVDGRLFFMPPCALDQQETSGDLAFELMTWVRAHRDFSFGNNEAGMAIGGDVRAADAAIWRTSDPGAMDPGLRRAPPVLAVEIAGREDTEPTLRGKARWYFAHGVEMVWLVYPKTLEVVVLTPSAETRCRLGEALPEHPSLPGLAPRVDDLFAQILRRPSTSAT